MYRGLGRWKFRFTTLLSIQIVSSNWNILTFYRWWCYHPPTHKLWILSTRYCIKNIPKKEGHHKLRISLSLVIQQIVDFSFLVEFSFNSFIQLNKSTRQKFCLTRKLSNKLYKLFSFWVPLLKRLILYICDKYDKASMTLKGYSGPSPFRSIDWSFLPFDFHFEKPDWKWLASYIT